MPKNPESPFGFGNPGGIHGGSPGKRIGPVDFLAARLRKHPVGAAVFIVTVALLVSLVAFGTQM